MHLREGVLGEAVILGGYDFAGCAFKRVHLREGVLERGSCLREGAT